MLTVEYGGVFFHSDQRMQGREPLVILKDGFSGWWGRPAARSLEALHASSHGAPRLPTRVGPRQVALQGRVLSLGRDVRDWGERLSGLPLEGNLNVKEGESSRWAAAQLMDVEFDWSEGTTGAEFQLVWRCPDPRKYGESRESVSTGANVNAFHYGNTDAWPVFEVTGFPNGYRIEGRGPNQGKFYTIEDKPAGAVDRIDFSSGMFMRDGAPRTRIAPQRTVWPVSPFVDTPWRVTALGSGSGSALMTVPDTYM